MPRRFSVRADSPAPVAAVLGAFGDARYWRDRFTEFGGGLELTALDVDDAGAISVRTVQDVRRESMAPLLARLYPRELRVLATERWFPVGDSADGTITVTVQGAPGAGEAAARLDAADRGCVLRVDGEVRVRVPVLGGPVERLVAHGFAAHVPELQRFTDEWLAAHA
ncbi:hypothetical protein AXK57_07700 [Tsukamurella pulmonis]|nr:DUF2505 domain-containing protein [Tsukamurella pulmonis]KXP11233.1 hypothetical protein AXK57_07700 [Tsukamurella pulmonis]RDH12860.1 DUF2505 domain-containing protein [Tsukamurella pulmonis]